jgi:hypothetical protein
MPCILDILPGDPADRLEGAEGGLLGGEAIQHALEALPRRAENGFSLKLFE